MTHHITQRSDAYAVVRRVTLSTALLALLVGMMPQEAEAGLCTTTLQIEFTDLAGLGTADFVGTPDTSFVGCSTSASATADLGPFGPGGDIFTIDVSAIDDDTLSVTAVATDGSDVETAIGAPEFWTVSALTIVFSDISWNSGPGELTDVTYNTFGPFGINPLSMAADGFSFRITPTVVGGCGAQQGCNSGLLNIATIDLTANHIDVAVPEPATLALMGLGMAGIGYRRFRENS